MLKKPGKDSPQKKGCTSAQEVTDSTVEEQGILLRPIPKGELKFHCQKTSQPSLDAGRNSYMRWEGARCRLESYHCRVHILRVHISHTSAEADLVNHIHHIQKEL